MSGPFSWLSVAGWPKTPVMTHLPGGNIYPMLKKPSHFLFPSCTPPWISWA
jgi:hypothetical protein